MYIFVWIYVIYIIHNILQPLPNLCVIKAKLWQHPCFPILNRLVLYPRIICDYPHCCHSYISYCAINEPNGMALDRGSSQLRTKTTVQPLNRINTQNQLGMLSRGISREPASSTMCAFGRLVVHIVRVCKDWQEQQKYFGNSRKRKRCGRWGHPNGWCTG